MDKTTINRKCLEPNVLVYNHNDFDKECVQLNIDDSNVENQEDYAFISIIGTLQVIDEYLGEHGTKHYFNANHKNVLNLDFDDVSKDRDFKYQTLNGETKVIRVKAISEEQAEQCLEFIENNIGKIFIIHCRAGRSRSQAFFRFITDFFEPYRNCNGNLANRCVTPNPEVLRKLKKAYYTKYNLFSNESTTNE